MTAQQTVSDEPSENLHSWFYRLNLSCVVPRPEIFGWVVSAALDAAPHTTEIYEDVVAQVEMPRWSNGKVVLIGDAAYAVSLVAGQGASMALAGGTLLGELLTPGTAIEPALRAMEAQLRPAVLKKQRSGRRTAHWFVPATPLHIALRNLAFRAMNTRLLSGLLSQVFSLDSKGFVGGRTRLGRLGNRCLRLPAEAFYTEVHGFAALQEDRILLKTNSSHSSRALTSVLPLGTQKLTSVNWRADRKSNHF